MTTSNHPPLAPFLRVELNNGELGRVMPAEATGQSHMPPLYIELKGGGWAETTEYGESPWAVAKVFGKHEYAATHDMYRSLEPRLWTRKKAAAKEEARTLMNEAAELLKKSKELTARANVLLGGI